MNKRSNYPIVLNKSEIREDLFWRKVDIKDDNTCWIWKGSMRNGYGQMNIGGHTRKTHRVAYTLVHGIIPDGMCVLHSCDNRACVNPSHLFLGDYADNAHDMVEKGRCSNGNYRGELASHARLTWKDVREIRQDYVPGIVTHKMLASKYGVTTGAISSIIRKITWLD